ncbi:MAG: hypothetical protein AB2A00_02855 [Myxococcota bacterium]
MGQRAKRAAIRRGIPPLAVAAPLALLGLGRPQPARALLLGGAAWLALLGLSRVFRLKARLRCWTPPVLSSWGALLLLLVATWYLCPPLVTSGKTLAAWDAPMHTWHAHNLATRLLPALRGYNPNLLFGWPEGDDYALFVYLPAALLHVLSFGLISVETATALEMLLATLLWPLAFWLWFRQEVGAWTALLAAVLVLWDPGWFHQIGTIPLLVVGLWPFRMSMATSMLVLMASQRWLREGTRRAFVLLVVTSLIACQLHVGGWVFLGYGVAALWLAGGAAGTTRERALRWVLVLVGATLATGWFMVPWLAQRELFINMSEPGEISAATLLQHLRALDPFGRLTPLELALCVGSAVWLALRGKMAGRFAVASLLVGTVLAVRDVMVTLSPDALRPIFETLMYPRFLSYARGAMVFCAGVVVVVLARWVWRTQVSVRGRDLSREALATLVAGGVVMMLVAASEKDLATTLDRTRVVPTVDQLPETAGLVSAARWLKENGPVDVLLAVEDVISNQKPTAHLPGHVQMLSGVPVVSTSELAAVAFINYVPGKNRYTPDQLRAGGITHWVARSPLPPAPWLTPVKSFDGAHLFEAERLLSDQRLTGAADGVRIERMDGERVILVGPEAGYTAVLRMRWTPRLRPVDGWAVTITRGAFLPGSPELFTRVEVPPGRARVELELGPPPRAVAGYLATVVGLLLLVLLWRDSRRFAPANPA